MRPLAAEAEAAVSGATAGAWSSRISPAVDRIPISGSEPNLRLVQLACAGEESPPRRQLESLKKEEQSLFF